MKRVLYWREENRNSRREVEIVYVGTAAKTPKEGLVGSESQFDITYSRDKSPSFSCLDRSCPALG